MRLLADENIPHLVVEFICNRGHDAIWVGEKAPGISDREVLSLATVEKRTLITFDTDFGELVFRLGLGAPFGIILFRLPPDSPSSIAQTVIEVLESQTDWIGHFSVIDENRIRMRQLPSS
jgi:predicted nuclease of predicted toxin-antitoxin system